MRRIAFYEDEACEQLRPLTLLRPVFELLCGHFSVRERWIRCAAPTEWGAWLRPWLCEAYALQHPEAHLNDAAWTAEAPTTLINGRWLPAAGPMPELGAEEAGYVDDTLVAVTVTPQEAAALAWDGLGHALERIAHKRRPVNLAGTLVRYPWDLVLNNGRLLEEDFRRRPIAEGRRQTCEHVVIQGPAENVFIDFTARIDPYVVIDAREGPVWIDVGARILPFTRVEGPACIGRESQLFRAHVRTGTTIGPQCRAGGEIEESILHGYVNKYHDGFLGHAYVCPWVNLGAETTNSDLKSDYSPVRVPLQGIPIETGRTKIGCFIGDHTKTGIGTLFNTGAVIGVMCLLLPSGELLPRHIPSFSRTWHGQLESPEGLLEQGIRTARIAMGRRNCELSAAEERLLRDAFERTRPEREAALARQRTTGQFGSQFRSA